MPEPTFGNDKVKGRAFGSPLARGFYTRASTAEVDPRAKPGAPAAVESQLGVLYRVVIKPAPRGFVLNSAAM